MAVPEVQHADAGDPVDEAVPVDVLDGGALRRARGHRKVAGVSDRIRLPAPLVREQFAGLGAGRRGDDPGRVRIAEPARRVRQNYLQ